MYRSTHSGTVLPPSTSATSTSPSVQHLTSRPSDSPPLCPSTPILRLSTAAGVATQALVPKPEEISTPQAGLKPEGFWVIFVGQEVGIFYRWSVFFASLWLTISNLTFILGLMLQSAQTLLVGTFRRDTRLSRTHWKPTLSNTTKAESAQSLFQEALTGHHLQSPQYILLHLHCQ